MASKIQGKRMSKYTPLNELTQQEQVTYLSNAAVTTFGAKVSEGDNINVNIPLSTLVPSVPVTDVTVNGSSVVSDGVAAVTVPNVPTAMGLAGDGLTANAGKLDVSNKVPSPGNNAHRGDVLGVATDSDTIVWTTPAVTAISPKNGAITVINTANDVASGGYFFDVNTDASLATVDVSVDNTTVRKLKVANPVPPTTSASDGDVLTYDTSDGIVWAAPQGGGGGGGLPDASKIIGQRTGSGGDYALFMPYCNITRDGDGNVATVGEIKWLWADVLTLPDGYKDIPQ